MAAYYNEIDPFKAEWLRQLIAAGLIAPGDVDERSIADVQPAELMGYTQCHFFAGIGVWSYALRNAGWTDDRECWTGSCPCPSFSAAGKGEGFADPRHLWPQWFRLIRECRPGTVIGEQIAAAIGHGWLDLVCGDMEAEGYAIAAAVLGAHSAGAPHIRQRLYFCADAEHRGLQTGRLDGECAQGSDSEWSVGPINEPAAALLCDSSLLLDTDGRESCDRDMQRSREQRLLAQDCRVGGSAHAERDGGRPDLAQREAQGRVADWRDSSVGDGSDTPQRGLAVCGSAPWDAGHAIGPRLERHFGDFREWRGPGWLDPLTARSVAEAGATRGFWADCDWWYGRDGKCRPAGPGIQPLAHGATSRVGRLRGYGDCIPAPTAQAFIEAYMSL